MSSSYNSLEKAKTIDVTGEEPNNKIISKCFDDFKSALSNSIPVAEVEAWLNSLYLSNFADHEFTFGGLNKFFSDYVKANHASLFRELIISHFGKQFNLNKDFKIFFIFSSKNEKSESYFPIQASLRTKTGLNDDFAIEKFVNGSNTDIAFAASNAVIEQLANPKYNPLFLCGSVGLGKTHLMQAIGLEIYKRKLSDKIWYCSAEGFTNNLIEGIRFNKTHEMRNKYRNLDLLLIDDIQFLENKPQTQEEFFHTLNELILNNKQVVISGDRYPREIKSIEQRLISRFSAGMVAKIETPDYETRLAIIKNELEARNFYLNSEVIDHIAHTVKSNVRDLKGILTKLEAEHSLLNLEITLESARIILKEVLNIDKSPKSVDEIINLVANSLSVKKIDILSEKRDQEISNARQIAMYVVREVTNFSYPVIGRYFDKNHSSVIQACKKVNLMLDESSEAKQLIDSLIKKLEA